MKAGFTIALVVAASACATAPAADRDVRVLVLNMHAGKDGAGADNLAGVASLVRSTTADVVLLQEVDRRTRRSGAVDQPRVLGARTGLHVAFGRTLDYDGGEYGIATLFRRRMTSERVAALPPSRPQRRAGGSTEPRGALITEGRTAIGRLRAINTHLDPSSDDRIRLEESGHLIALVTASAEGLPQVVGGDFNSTPESAVQQRLRAAGLRDAWLECGAGDGYTYPAIQPLKRIDYLFLLGPVRCTSAAVLDSRASDHRPLLVVIRRGATSP